MSTLLQDSFTDTNGTNLTAHTMDVGAGWSQLNGAWQVQGNRARPPTATDTAIDTAEAGQADVTAKIDLIIPAGNPLVISGLSIRVSDSSNSWLCAVEGDDGITYALVIFERVAGVNTLRASQALVANPSATTITLTVVASGTTITLSANTGESCSYTSANSNLTVTKHGLYAFTLGYTVIDEDNFLVTSPAGGGVFGSHFYKQVAGMQGGF